MTPSPRAKELDTDQDRYPNLEQVLSRLSQDVAKDYPVVERVEITCLASGEATYRVWRPREIDPDGGYMQQV